MFITINDTEKQGFISIELNDLYDLQKSDTKKKLIRKSFITGISLVGRNSDMHVQIFDANNQPIYLVTHIVYGTSIYYPISEVNGQAPTSAEDLYNKILAIL
jgi:hypothetical protein